VKLLGWKKVVRGTLRGFLDIEVSVEHAHALQIFECPVNVGPNGPWVGLPGKPQIDRDGNLRRKPNGKPEYVAVNKWGNAETRELFSRAALRLLLARHPDALDGEAA
jgi:hypothetical protein